MAEQQSVYRALGRVSQLALTVGLVQMLVPGTVLAQDAPAASAARTDPDEIIVTARRREESAQKVPVAITALTAEMLQERRIVGGQDLQGQVPSLSVSAGGQSRDVETIAIRGQGTNYTAAPAVVTYLAEVPLVAGRVVTLQGTPGQFLDLANIQVLRGPRARCLAATVRAVRFCLNRAGRPTSLKDMCRCRRAITATAKSKA